MRVRTCADSEIMGNLSINECNALTVWLSHRHAIHMTLMTHYLTCTHTLSITCRCTCQSCTNPPVNHLQVHLSITHILICQSLKGSPVNQAHLSIVHISLNGERDFHASSTVTPAVGGHVDILSDDLRTLHHNRPPPRAVRKSIFSAHLW